MESRLREYIESVFTDAPATRYNVELKEELLQNLIDKYNDLISQGKAEEAAYNIAIATLGDIEPLIRRGQPGADDSALKNIRKKSATLKAVAIMLYIMCPVPLILLSIWGLEIAGLVIMLLFIATATGMLIYNESVNKPLEMDSTTVDEFREWQETRTERNSTFKAISSALWAVVTVIYFIVSFTTGAWHISWLIFLIGGAIESVIKAIFELRK